MELNDLEFVENLDETGNNEISEIQDISELEDLIATQDDDQPDGLESIENDENKNEQSNDNNAYILAKTLKDEGILTFIDDEEIKGVKDADTIAKVMHSQVEKMFLNKVKEEYGETGEKLFKLKEEGADVSQLIKVDKDLQNISQIDDDVFTEDSDENKSIRYGLIVYDLTLKGIETEEAKQLAQVYVETGKDVEKSKVAKLSIEGYLNNMKEKIMADEQKKINDKKNESKIFSDNLKTKLKETKEIFPTFSIDDKARNEIYDSILKPAGKIDGKSVNNVEKWISENKIESQIILHYLYNITDGFKKFDGLVNKAKSKAVSELDRKLKENAFNIDNGRANKHYFGANKDVVGPDQW